MTSWLKMVSMMSLLGDRKELHFPAVEWERSSMGLRSLFIVERRTLGLSEPDARVVDGACSMLSQFVFLYVLPVSQHVYCSNMVSNHSTLHYINSDTVALVYIKAALILLKHHSAVTH